MNRFDLRAISLAMLMSLALDVVGSFVLVAAFSDGVTQGMTAEEMHAVIQQVVTGSGFLLASLVYGSATTVFGGYVAARLARGYPYFNALAVGVAGILLGLLLEDESPWWYDLLAYLVCVPAALYGARLSQQRVPPPQT